jgi:hypothetical protein
VVVGSFWGFGPYWGPWWYGPPAYYWPGYDRSYAPYEAAPAAEPTVYIERRSDGYWYYCPSAGAYYPTAPSCPEAWVTVPARAP